MGVSVDFPEELLVVAKESREEFTHRVMVQTLGQLYVEGKISSGLAAKVLGCTRQDFYRVLSCRGFAVIDYEAHEEDYETKTSRELAERSGE